MQMRFCKLFKRFNQKISDPDPMKYLIVGLGNIGEEYVDTRHNIGFTIVDQIVDKFGAKWETETLGQLASIKSKGRTYYLLKPSTYMNRSGKAVRHWMTKLKIKINNVLIVTDDKNLPFGKQRMRGKGSDGGHNGLKDIQQMLATSQYPRLRFGIGSEFHCGQQVDFVLGKWTQEEMDVLPKFIEYASETILAFGFLGLSRAMNQYNRK
ncbi:MAG: aminoacyl-tRNA hydrolase [Bacteroidia bacterium]|nr:aminoacyl-tRNA hydrolase [Bacteroidia bacterium]